MIAPAENEVLRSEWWERLFQLSEDAQAVCTRQGEFWAANRLAQRLLGLPPRGSGETGIGSCLTQATACKVAGILSRPNSHAETLPSISILQCGRVSLLADLVLTPLSEGFWLVTFRDASRRWRMESHVQRLAAAVDATSDVFFLTDAEMRLTFVNAAFHSATGHTIEEALGRTADFLRAPSQAGKIAAYSDAVKNGRDWMGELVNVRADGTSYPVEATISPIHDRKGEFIGYVSCERDIAAKKKLQDDVLLERNYARSIHDSLDAAIYTLDRQFRITHLNERWRVFPKTHGCLTLERGPRTGDALLDFVKEPARRGEIKERFEQVLGRKEPSEFCCASADGTHWQVKISPWTHANEVIGLIYVVSDQTRFHQLQAQLFQAQKMETLGALAAGVAHDFNNLLQVIRGHAMLLLSEEGLSPLPVQRLEQMSEAAARASEITDQLLSFSRASEEKLTVFDFNHLITEASQLAQRSLKGSVQLSLRPSGRPLKVKMDSTRAHQLLLNLCVNAQDAMPGGGALTISNTELELPPFEQGGKVMQGGKFVRCTVSDTGTGIPREVLPRIFDPFFTTKEAGKGTGLGLSIAKSAVTNAGGKIDVETEPGKGTSFHIYLPLVEEELTHGQAVSGQARTHGVGRVLVVEDLDLVRDFTQTFLKGAGLTVLLARDAAEALEILEEQEADLVLTDFNMPGMNGIELIEEIRPRWPALKLVLASGYLQDAQRERVTSEFGARILKKPYNPKDATHMILELLADKD